MMMPPPESGAYPGLPAGRDVVRSTLAGALQPPPQLSVAEWAERFRMISAESGSPYPGRWSTDLVPYTREIMECLSFTDPCRSVTFVKSHQVAGTEVGVNLLCYVIDHAPAPIMLVLPTLDEASKYEKIKLTPTFAATPQLRRKVKTERSRDRDSSTLSFKRFAGGGFLQITGANSSAGLQMISARVGIFEEISEWPEDTGNRGDPLAQAEKRLTAWARRRPKRFYNSTPKIRGVCRIDAKFQASDQRRFYVPCPHCGDFQVLRFENLKWRDDTPPHGAYFVCASNGCIIEHFEKKAMTAAGVWIRTYPDEKQEPGPVISPDLIEIWRQRPAQGREPGFHIWQAYSPFVDWDDMVSEWLESRDNPLKEKVFVQQVLGQPFEETGEAPDHEKLLLRREPYPLGQIPPGGLVLTGMADVQQNRIEFGVYAWGIGLTGWLIDRGEIEGDPSELTTWQGLDAVVSRTYEDWQGKRWPVEAFGVDAGYLSTMVYLFTRSRPRVFALDGRPGHLRPPIGTPSQVDVSWQGRKIKGGARLWPTGTWPLKSTIYAALNKTIQGPDENGNWPLGALHFPDAVDLEFFKQITAEFQKEVVRRGAIVREWHKIRNQPNEALDIAVGARALASHLGLDNFSRARWQQVAEERGAPPEEIQRDLSELWSPRPGDNRPTEVKVEDGKPRPAQTPRGRGRRVVRSKSM